MSRFWRVIKWFGLGLGLLLILVVVAAVFYTRTANFNRWAREQMITAVNGSIRGSLAVERLEGSVWDHLTLYNVILNDDEGEIAKIPRLDVSFSLLSLIFGRLQVSQFAALQPELQVQQDRDGKWNLVEALSPRAPEPETSDRLSVLVRALRIDHGVIALQLADAKSYRFEDFNLNGDVGVRPGSVSVNLSDMTTLLKAEGQPDLRLKGALDYQQGASTPGVLKIKDLWAVSRSSRVKLNGQFTADKSAKISARVALEKLAPADIAYFAPQLQLKHDIAGQLSVDGTLDGLSGDLELTAAGAKAVGKFRADVTRDQPLYSATVQLGGLDLRRWVDARNVAGVLDGTAELIGDGFALAHTTGKASVQIRSAQAQGWTLGLVTLNGRLQDRVAAFEGNLKSKLGGAAWTGKIALGERRPTYELALSVQNLDVEQTMTKGEALQGKLNFRGTVKGAGFNLADMNTHVEFKLLPSTLGPVKINQGELNAAISEKKIRITRAALATAESTLSAAGELGLGAEIGGKLDYRLRVADVSPWLALAKSQGSGALEVTGVARGNLADLRTEGSARLSGLRLAGVGVRDGNAKYALQGSKEQLFPRGTVTMQLAEVDAGLSLRRIDASAKLARQPSQSIQLDISAQDAGNHKHTFSGLVGFAADELTVRLNQAALTLDGGVWKLAQPAMLTKRGETFVIDELALKNGTQGLQLHGRFGFSGPQDLKLVANGIPLKALAEFLPQQPKMTGLVGLNAQIGGTAAAPEIVATVRLRDTTIAGQTYAGASADASYKDKRVSLGLAVRQDATHALNGSGTLPVNLSWANGVRAELAGDMNFRAQSAGINLGFLNAFSGKSVTNLSGEVSLDVLARGPVKQPELRGQFRIRDGRAKLVPLGVEINAITLAGSLASQVLTITELTAKANDGEIRGSGSLALKDFDIGAFKVVVNARRWPAIETARYQIRVAGNVEVQGTLTAPKITGQMTVIDGSLRPDVAFLEQSKVSLKRDETIVIVKNSAGEPQPQRQNTQRVEQNDSEFFKRLSLDLKLRAPGNLWIRHPQLVSELSGDIQARKTPNHDVDLTGRVEMVRGWFAFQGRRFELARGIIEFTGGDKINPSLDILAEYRLPQYQVDANIGGTVEKPSLTLTSTPRLEQADILALLIFGKPMAALNQKEQGSLQQSALSISSGYVASKIANSVAGALGLDSLGVDINDVDFSGEQVGFGRYIGRDTYVSVSQQLSGERGREVAVEYQVAPDWKIGTSTTSTGSNGIDVIWHKRY